MNKVAKLSFISILLIQTACYDEEEFPDAPRIEFRSLEYVDTSTADSLILRFHFEDGDANLGFTDDDNAFSYDLLVDSEPKVLTANNIDSIVPPVFLAPMTTQNDGFVRLDENLAFVNLSTRSLPAILTDIQYTEEIAFECPNQINQDGNLFKLFDGITVYEVDDLIITSLFDQQIDTSEIVVLPAIYRESYYNIVVRFQRVLNGEPELDAAGQPKYINFGEELGETNCQIGEEAFNARVPLFDQDGRSGTITYNMISILLRLGVGDNPFQVVFFVTDRSGNQSNEVISPTFTWSEITRN